MECVFCAIIEKRLPAEIVFEDEECVAFKDIHPKAVVHLLLVPKRHLVNLGEVTEEDIPLLGKLLIRSRTLAETMGIASSGFKVVINSGTDAGQIVDHLHCHLLGGEHVSGIP